MGSVGNPGQGQALALDFLRLKAPRIGWIRLSKPRHTFDDENFFAESFFSGRM